MLPIVKQFDALTRDQIRALRPGTWSDLDLLDVLQHFETAAKDRDRAMAVAELILRSPQVGDVDYHMLYLDLVGYYRWNRDFPAALRWAHALVAHDEQHDEGRNRANTTRDLAETYLQAGDPSASSGQSLNTGLALFARLAQATPADIWSYNALGFALPRAGLPRLALEVLDYALTLVARRDQEQLKGQFTDLRRRTAEALAATLDHTDEVSPAVMTAFRAALMPPQAPPPARESATPYLPPVAQLLTSRPDEATLESAAPDPSLIPELIRLAFDPALPVDGAPARAVAILRAWQDAHVAELGELAAWLDHATGDWRTELLSSHCGKVGGYTTPELEAIAADTQYSVHVRSSATESLVERAERVPAQRKRIVAFLRTLLTRPEAETAGEEAFVGFLIGDILDLDARELYPDIQRAFAEDRVDTSIIDLPDVHRHWNLAPLPRPQRRSDGLYLRLRCTACDRIREHFVQQVLLDIGTLEQQMRGNPVAYDPYIMDHEIVCPKCGAVDRYAMTPQAHLALTVLPQGVGDLADLLAGKKSAADLPLNPRLHPFHAHVFGQPMHPLAGLAEYRRRIAAHPRDARLQMRMGTLLRTIYRFPEALAAHRQAYTLNPNDAEIALALGMSEHDFGDRAAAKEMYERVLTLELKGPMRWRPFRSDTWAGAAAEGLDRLKRRQSSPSALPAPPPAVEPRPSASKRRSPPHKKRRRR